MSTETSSCEISCNYATRSLVWLVALLARPAVDRRGGRVNRHAADPLRHEGQGADRLERQARRRRRQGRVDPRLALDGRRHRRRATRSPFARAAARRRTPPSGNAWPPGSKLPMSDNGIIVTLSGCRAGQDDHVRRQAGEGHVQARASFRTASGCRWLDGNLTSSACPPPQALAATTADEDYPAVAPRRRTARCTSLTSSFTRGKDFQGARERPATPESGPDRRPARHRPVRMIEKPEDLDYLAQPAGGEQIYLRIRTRRHVERADRRDRRQARALSPRRRGRRRRPRLGLLFRASRRRQEPRPRQLGADGPQLRRRRQATPASRSTSATPPGPTSCPRRRPIPTGKVVGHVGRRARGEVPRLRRVSRTARSSRTPQRVSEFDGQRMGARHRRRRARATSPSPGTRTTKATTTLRRDAQRATASFGKPQAVAASLAFEVRPSLAYDATAALDRLRRERRPVGQGLRRAEEEGHSALPDGPLAGA